MRMSNVAALVCRTSVIAWLTVSVQTWLVARAKPMNALRYE